MKLNFGSILTLIMLAVWIIQSVRIVLSQKAFTWKTILNFLASACMIIGAVGFFGSGLSSTGSLGALTSFEWPIGDTNAALRYPDGRIVVPHEPSGRVQVYDRSLKFIRGWSVNAGGGSFKLLPAPKNTLYVFSSRRSMKFHYDLNGKMLSSQSYSDYHLVNRSEVVSVSIPTPFYLQIFTDPFRSWFVGAFGMLLLFITGEARRKKPNK